jgi:hypothetical protein
MKIKAIVAVFKKINTLVSVLKIYEYKTAKTHIHQTKSSCS